MNSLTSLVNSLFAKISDAFKNAFGKTDRKLDDLSLKLDKGFDRIAALIGDPVPEEDPVTLQDLTDLADRLESEAAALHLIADRLETALHHPGAPGSI